jgi:rhamnogalacturonan endolyase
MGRRMRRTRLQIGVRTRLQCERLEDRVMLDGAGGAGAADATPDDETPLAVSATPRIMENLGRGVLAVRASSSQVFVSWRLLGLDPTGIAFNVYRSANGGAPVKLNASPLATGTNYTDATANAALANAYHVRPVLGGVEQAASAAYTLAANTAVQPLFAIPLRNIGGTAESQDDYYVAATWVGDLDGDGEYDFVVARIVDTANTPNNENRSDVVEAYRRDGAFLWAIDMGPNSLNKNNIEPGPSAIMTGNWDGVTVADLDLDGKAEVMLRTAGGVIFGDGAALPMQSNVNFQFISVVDGMTGAEKARVQLPTDYLSDGPLAPMLGVGYLDGVHPSLVAKMKNRVGSGSFNEIIAAWDYDGTAITQRWKWLRGNTPNRSDGHQIRIVDVDQDGADDIAEIGFVLDGNGTVKYTLGPTVIHGDRFHIGDLDPDRPGLEGFGVQQDNANLLYEYYYDAATGELLHTHYGTAVGDVGRGIAADVDPAHRGYEYWSFSGIHNSKTPVAGQPPVETKLTNEPNRPWPNFRIWWDGDVLSENLNRELIDKWNPSTQGTSRVATLYNYGAIDTWRDAPVFYGDIIGDWREEVIFEHNDRSKLLVFTTTIASSTRLYTLPHNPEYRNSLTVHGYYQSHMVDYYLGSGMTTPPTPYIAYAGQQQPTFDRTYQAEAAIRSTGVLVESNYAGFNGTGFVNMPTTGGSLEWTNVDGGDGGLATVRFRFALGAAGTRTGRLTINGVTQDIAFASTGAWNNWAVISVDAGLSPGLVNSIKLQSTGQDLANIDELQVTAILPPPSADFDGNQQVDGNDFLTWQRGLGATNALPNQGDANRDAVVNADDLSFWRSQASGSSQVTVLAAAANFGVADDAHSADWSALAVSVALADRDAIVGAKSRATPTVRDRAITQLFAASSHARTDNGHEFAATSGDARRNRLLRSAQGARLVEKANHNEVADLRLQLPLLPDSEDAKEA